MVVSTSLAYLGSSFSEEKNTVYLRVFSAVAYSSYKICIPLHCGWSDKTPMSPKRILHVPKSTEFFHRF